MCTTLQHVHQIVLWATYTITRVCRETCCEVNSKVIGLVSSGINEYLAEISGDRLLDISSNRAGFSFSLTIGGHAKAAAEASGAGASVDVLNSSANDFVEVPNVPSKKEPINVSQEGKELSLKI